jgi:signal transduction histidine kinase
MILLHENGYKTLAATNSGDDLRLVVTELQRKIVRVGEGDLNVTVGFSNRNNDIGDLGRNFNRMVLQLRENREDVERLHRTQMSRAERLATLGELAAGLAHEIRNPLAGIAGVIEIVGRDLPVTSSACAVVEDVRLENAQINHILNDFLQAARPHLPEVRPSDLNITVEHAVMLVCQQVASTPIRIELQKDPTLPSVEHDSGQIHQLVLNLLLNAVQAIDGAGAVRVQMSALQGDAAITVLDTGCGIAPEHLTNIFRPFYTTKGNGTGLGLSLARQIAEEHHGRIEVTSEVGKGTTFVVILPLQQTKAREASSCLTAIY